MRIASGLQALRRRARRSAIVVTASAALVAGFLAGPLATPASAVETITTTPATYDPTATMTITVNGFPTMAAGFGYIYWLDFQNLTGAPANTGASTGALGSQVDCAATTGVTFALAGGAGDPNPNGQNVVGNTNGCEWISPTKFKFSYKGATGLDASSVVDITFPIGAFTLPAGGQYGVNFTAGAAQNWQLSYVCWGNCPVGGADTPPQVTIEIDGNGGTCRTTAVTGTMSLWAKAPDANDCKRPDGRYFFANFNTSKDGSGLTIAPSGNLHLTGDNRLYAQWTNLADMKPPLPPTNVTAVSKWNAVTVSYSAAKLQPGPQYPVTNYLVTSTPGNRYCITSERDTSPLECTFTNLTPGTPYTFTAQALNGEGWGDRSVASNVASPLNLKITGYSRKKDMFLFINKGSTSSVNGIAPGYAARTPITPWVKVGDGAWMEQKKDRPVVDPNGKFAWSRQLGKNDNGKVVSVKFTIDGTNVSNTVAIPGVR